LLHITKECTAGLKLNINKCLFCVSEVTFLGHILSCDGIKADPKKIQAISEFPCPKDKVELQRFLGMINYLAKFIPHLSSESAPLRILLENNTIWQFNNEQLVAFNKLKTLVSQAPVLKFYNPNLSLKISSDASQTGLGAILEQQHDNQWHPIAYASRSLSNAEKNYSQIEKETLSIMFACERFHEYVYGQKFIVENDHKPLQSIFQKSIAKSPPRIQRFRLRLQRYDFNMNYTPGKDLHVSDALSRASLPNDDSEIDENEMNTHIHTVMSTLLISDNRLKQIQIETEKDLILQKVIKNVQNGWPASRNEIDNELKPYSTVQENLTYTNGILLKDLRVVIPTSLRNEIKKIIHAGHIGIERTKLRSRQSIYWPGINNDITEMISNCETCLTYRSAQQKETLLPHDIPSNPWFKVGTDLFFFKNKNYLIVADYHSKYFDISYLPNIEATTVVSHTKAIFARFGIPKEVVSDNGSQFTSSNYRVFAKEWDFKQTTSSPRYPQSNGFIERTIQTVKKLLKSQV